MPKQNYYKKLVLLGLLSMPFSVNADYLVDGGYNWNLDFTDSNNKTSYVIADYNNSNPDDSIYETNGIANNSLQTSTYGGEDFDGERMYLEIREDTLHLAIVTGLTRDHTYASGDILFDLNGDMTNPDGSLIDSSNFSRSAQLEGAKKERIIRAKSTGSSDGYEFGLVVKDHNTTQYMEDSKIFDFGYSASAGDLYSLDEWNSGTDLFNKLRPASGRVAQGTETVADIGKGNVSLYYGDGVGIANSLYVIEASIALTGNTFGDELLASALSDGTINVHWNPLCNNDWLQYTGSIAYNAGGTSVPEPAPLALMAIGLVGLIVRRNRIK